MSEFSCDIQAMRTLLVALAIAFWAAPATAETFAFSRDGQPFQMTMPPTQWVTRPPLAPISVWPGAADFVRTMCSTSLGSHEDMGCTVLLEDVCMIYVNRELEPRTYAAVLRHEGAHCRGWPADHPTEYAEPKRRGFAVPPDYAPPPRR